MSPKMNINQISLTAIIATLATIILTSNGQLQQDAGSSLAVVNNTAENLINIELSRSDSDETSSSTLVDRLSRLREARTERIKGLQETVKETIDNIRGKRAQPDTEVYKVSLDLPIEGPVQQDTTPWTPVALNAVTGSSEAEKQANIEVKAPDASVQYDDGLDNQESRSSQGSTWSSGQNYRWVAVGPDDKWKDSSRQLLGRSPRDLRQPPAGFSQPLDQVTSSDQTDHSHIVVHQDPMDYPTNYVTVNSNAHQENQPDQTDTQPADSTWPSDETDDISRVQKESQYRHQRSRQQPNTLQSLLRNNQEQSYADGSQKTDNAPLLSSEPKFKGEETYGKRSNQLKSAESYDHASIEHEGHGHHHGEHEHGHGEHEHHHEEHGNHHEEHGHNHEEHGHHHEEHGHHHEELGHHEEHGHHEDHGYEREDKVKCEEEKKPVKKEEKHHHYHHYHHHHHEPKEKHVVKVKEVKKVHSQPVHLEIHIKGKAKGKGKGKKDKKKKKGGEEVYIKIGQGEHKGEHSYGHEHGHGYGYDEGEGVAPKNERGQSSLIEDKTSLVGDSDPNDKAENNEGKTSKVAKSAAVSDSDDRSEEESNMEDGTKGDKGEETGHHGEVMHDYFEIRDEEYKKEVKEKAKEEDKDEPKKEQKVEKKEQVKEKKEKKKHKKHKKEKQVVEKEKVEEPKAEVKEEETPKEEMQKPEEQKAEEPKKHEAKVEEPIKEEPKKEEPKKEEPKKEEPKKEEPKKEEPKKEEHAKELKHKSKHQHVELHEHKHFEHHQHINLHKPEEEHHQEEVELGGHHPLYGQHMHEPIEHQQHGGGHNLHNGFGAGHYGPGMHQGRIPLKEEWIVPDMIEKPISEHDPQGGFVFEDHSEMDRPLEAGYQEEVANHPHGLGLTPSGVHGLMGLFSTPVVAHSTSNSTVETKVQSKPKGEKTD